VIDHLSLGVADLARSRAFYDAVLRPLGYERRFEDAESCAYGAAGAAADTPIGVHAFAFWIGHDPEARPGSGHTCFAATSRAAVDGFHAAALAAGGRDNGAPGLRPHYHPNYYAAFAVDPDGNRLEAVAHTPEQEEQRCR
jgi:catechol 2,3-dioxygenase-like lactoylglutathione lyase family enzyme